MAEQCIVCLEDLDHAPKLDDADPSPTVIAENDLEGTDAAQQHNSTTPQHSTSSGQQKIACISGCNHVLHDVCLKEWTQKANSCPICRTQFNQVEVRETTTGPVIAEYEVKDKKQIADFDPLSWIQEQEQEEEIDRPCPVCGTQDDEDQLLLCDACNAPYHTYCTGEDGVPEGHWFCIECRGEAGDNATESEPSRPAAVAARRYRTLAQLRQSRSRHRVRQGAWEGAWNQIASRVHEATGYDLDFDGQDELQEYRQAQNAHNRNSREERELREWEQRIQIANRQGAGREFRSNILGRTVPVYEAPAPPPQETDDERRAWATYERERQRQEQSAAGTASPSRKRKATESPQEPQAQNPEPERKLKRPRTRRNRPQENAGPSSEHVDASAMAPIGHGTPQTSTPRRSPPRTVPAAAAPAPSFLSSLLKEVEESCKGDHGDSDTPHTNGTSPGIEHNSPILSPSTSNFSTPRPLSLTPPPRRSGSPRQTPISSIVEPIYPIPNPADYSPNRPTPQRSVAGTPPPTSPSGLSLRHPQPQRNGPHRALFPASPASPGAHNHLSHLSEEDMIKRKEVIKNMVKMALDSKWRERLSSEQYTTVNRKVCRKLYDKVPDLNLLSENEIGRWQYQAGKEVQSCVVALGYAQPVQNNAPNEDRTPREGVTA